MTAPMSDVRRIRLSNQQQMRRHRDLTSRRAGNGRQLHTVATTFDVTGRFEPSTFERACRLVIDRHPVLALAFHEESEEDGWLLDPHSFRIERISAAASGTYDDDGFEDGGFKLRCLWEHVSPTSGALSLLVDHIAVDGRTWATLIGDLAHAYNCLADESPVQFDSAALPFHEFADLEAERLDEAEVDARLAYWRGRLDPLEPYSGDTLPGARRPTGADRQARHVTMRLDVDVRALAALLHVTPFALIMGAQLVVRHRRTGRHVLTTHLQVDLRPPEFVHSVGWFSQNIVLRVPVPDGGSFGEFCSEVLATLWDGAEHALPPLTLQRAVQPTFLQQDYWRPSCFWDVRDASETFLDLVGCDVRERPADGIGALRAGAAFSCEVHDGHVEVLGQFEAGSMSDGAMHTFLSEVADVLLAVQHAGGDVDVRSLPVASPPTGRPTPTIDFLSGDPT